MAVSETVLKCRGLPWSAEPEDILEFFEGCAVVGGTEGVKLMTTQEGRPSGEAYIEFETPLDAQNALKKHNEHMGSRYIEVFSVKTAELEWILKKEAFEGPIHNKESVVRLRGLPFGCTKEDIEIFFAGLAIVPNGIMLQLDESGRTTGSAYVNFMSPEIADKAIQKHKETIGHRYIEVFHSSMHEALICLHCMMGDEPVNERPRPYDRNNRFGGRGQRGGGSSYGGGGGQRSFGSRGGRGMRRGSGGRFGGGGGYNSNDSGFRSNSFADRAPRGRGDRNRRPGSSYSTQGSTTGHSVHMRGLPYAATEDDIAEFFSPVQPVMVEIEYNSTGRPSGEADVDFSSHNEALQAMQNDHNNIGGRYIELFLNSSNDPRPSRGGGSFSGAKRGFSGGAGDLNSGMRGGGYIAF